MNILDFRIGNKLNYHGQTVIILEIKKNNIVTFGYFTDSIGFERNILDEDFPKPIQITGELLVEYNFTQEGVKDKLMFAEWYMIETHKIVLSYISGGSGYYQLRIDDKNLLYYFSYLHELQNIIYSLTKKELCHID